MICGECDIEIVPDDSYSPICGKELGDPPNTESYICQDIICKDCRNDDGSKEQMTQGGMEMECKCPSGYPKRVQRDFGSEARAQAFQWNIPVPGFEVEVHTGKCSLTDEVKVPLLSFIGE